MHFHKILSYFAIFINMSKPIYNDGSGKIIDNEISQSFYGNSGQRIEHQKQYDYYFENKNFENAGSGKRIENEIYFYSNFDQGIENKLKYDYTVYKSFDIQNNLSSNDAVVGRMSLENDGWFVARIQIHYKTPDSSDWEWSDQTTDILYGQTRVTDLYPIANGSAVIMHAVVIGGIGKTATQEFTFDDSSTNCAKYSVSGTTLINSLAYHEIGTC